MKLAVNFSDEAARLIKAGAIATDLFKAPDWPELLAAAQGVGPTYVHFGFRAVPGGLDGMDWAMVDDMLASTETRYVNVHLYPEVGTFPQVDPHAADPAGIAAVADGMLAVVAALTERFGPERVIAENMPYWSEPTNDVYRPAVLPEVIGRIIAETGCGFLLDVAHARLAAAGLGIDEREYISSLPVAAIREMHVGGLGVLGDRVRDHQALTADDWAAFEWALEQIHTGKWAEPWLVTFEYGGMRLPPPWPSEESVLAEQMPRLYDMVRAM